jgi:signal transduction histidine kinase
MRRLRGLTTVRARTTLVASLVVALALLAGAVILVQTLQHSLETATDQQARSRLTQLRDDARSGSLPRVIDGIGDDSLAQVVAADGRVLAASENIVGRPAVASVEETGRQPTARTMRGLPDDQETEDYRIWSARTDTRDGAVAVFVGPSLESSQEATHRLVTSLAAGLPLLVLLLALAIWVTVGRALRPVENVRREVARLGVHSLDSRVRVPPTNDEVARLASTMNELLDRLEAADHRQREFVANASHDLQSPLSVFRTEVEVAMARADLEEWRRTGRRLLDESDRMEALVADLLFLAQVEDLHSVERSPLDLEELVAEEVARLQNERRVGVTLTVGAAPVRGNRQQLSRMVRNLLLNAVEFADSRVTVTVGAEDDTAVLVVDDDGPGVAEERRLDVFDRFVTLDRARDRRAGGTGLGLAIARSVADAHGGSITLDGEAPTSRFVVRLPGL